MDLNHKLPASLPHQEYIIKGSGGSDIDFSIQNIPADFFNSLKNMSETEKLSKKFFSEILQNVPEIQLKPDEVELFWKTENNSFNSSFFLSADFFLSKSSDRHEYLKNIPVHQKHLYRPSLQNFDTSTIVATTKFAHPFAYSSSSWNGPESCNKDTSE